MNIPSSSFLPPEFSIAQENSHVQIKVITHLPKSLDPDTYSRVKNSILEESKKSSLMGIAYIRQLNEEKIPLASNIVKIYEDYLSFFETHDKEMLLGKCNALLQNEETEEIIKEMALYIKNCLNGSKSEKSKIETSKKEKTEGEILVKQLLPSLKKTLQLNPPQQLGEAQLVSIPEMKASHNAFPDLINYKGEHYLCFREANSHVGYLDFGKVRILKGEFREAEGSWNWTNIALLSSETYDFRDPKFFIDGQDKLRLIIDGSLINEKDETTMMVPHVAELNENGEWSIEKADVDPSSSGEKGQWIWRVTWNSFDNCGYGFSYDKDKGIYLMKTEDGVSFKAISYIGNELLPRDALNEATIRFKKNGEAIALIRTSRNGLIALASPEDKYKTFRLSIIPFRLGGPNFLISKKNEKMWAATRHFFLSDDNTLDETTIVGYMTKKKLVPLMKLKSSGDSSYPGMVEEQDGTMTIVYYSSDEDEKSHIFITRIKPDQ